MVRTTLDNIIHLTAQGYELNISPSAIDVIVAGEVFCTLDPRCAVDTVEKKDAEGLPEKFSEKSFSPDFAEYEWISKSDAWEEKIYTLICREDRFEYFVTVCGEGDVDAVNYFSGDITERCHGSSFDFYEGYHPLVHLDGKPMTYGTNANYGPFSYLTVPPMFYHAFRLTDVEPCLALGLVAEMGEHNFTKFDYNISEFRWGTKFWLSTDQSGHTKVRGSWTAPRIAGYCADSYLDAGRKYCDIYFDEDICSRGDDSVKPRFWHGPIACGWLEQLAHHYAGNGELMDNSRQSVYEEMVEKLHARELYPQILIIDDKWQEKYCTAEVNRILWNDLRGFIDSNSEKGIHTLMWYKLWDKEGIPEEYCVWDDNVGRYVADPSNPGYRAILRENIRRIISSEEGCYNAEGLKIDFAFWQPLGRGASSYSGQYGVELLYEYISFIRQCVKEIKPHAIINASPCHPIFASLVDQARLHDYDYKQRNALEEFTMRAELYKTALPFALIDTDGCGYNTRRDTVKYLTRSREIGIPDTYAVSPTPYLTLSDEDWKKISVAWKEYGESVDKFYK